MKYAPKEGKAFRFVPLNVIRVPPAVMPFVGHIPVISGNRSGAVDTAV